MPNEVCDDGAPLDGVGCLANCTGVIPGYVCISGTIFSPSICTGKCGDNIIVPGEDCEDHDGGPFSGDGCSSTCKFETGFTCQL